MFVAQNLLLKDKEGDGFDVSNLAMKSNSDDTTLNLINLQTLRSKIMRSEGVLNHQDSADLAQVALTLINTEIERRTKAGRPKKLEDSRKERNRLAQRKCRERKKLRRILDQRRAR